MGDCNEGKIPWQRKPQEVAMRDSYFSLTAILGGVGIPLALFAWACAAGHAHNPEDTLFFGTEIPMAAFGITGYTLIALTAIGARYLGKPLAAVNHVLVAFAGLFTIYLVVKSMQVGLACPGCWLCWTMNTVLICRLGAYAFSRSEQQTSP